MTRTHPIDHLVSRVLRLPAAGTGYRWTGPAGAHARRRDPARRPLRPRTPTVRWAPSWCAVPTAGRFVLGHLRPRMPPAATTWCSRACAAPSLGREFVPMVHEADDATDTVAWLREQPWFTGTFGTIGCPIWVSPQWALLADPPPELAAAVVTVGPHDLHMSSWGRGRSRSTISRLVGHGGQPGVLGIEPAGLPAAGTAPADRGGRRGSRWAKRALVTGEGSPGTNPGSPIPTPTTRSGNGCGWRPHWTATVCRCCCSAGGRTSSSTRPSPSTGSCVTAVSTWR